METHNSVCRYPHKFSIENILSKPVCNGSNQLTASQCYHRLLNNVGDRGESVTSLSDGVECRAVNVSRLDQDSLLDSTQHSSDGRVSSPESSFTEELMEDGKSDIASEDDNGKIVVCFY